MTSGALNFRMVFLTLLGLLGLETVAHAHKLLVEVHLREAEIQIEAFYEDDTPAEEAKVRLFSTDNPEIAKGITNDKGVWKTARPSPGEYKVRIESVGHGTTITFTVPPPEPAANPAKGDSSADPVHKAPQTPWLYLGIGIFILAAFSSIPFWRRKFSHKPGSSHSEPV